MTSNQLLSAALAYAQRGWPVLPLHTPTDNGCSCKKAAACASIGKHPRIAAALSNATTDARTIRAWWSKWPDANLGILTGSESGLLVVDVDEHGDVHGSDNLAAIASEHGGIPATLTAATGGGGKHLFFRHPGVPIKNSVGQIATGVDVRAERGIIVAAPSLHISGKRYEFDNPEQPLGDIPGWLLARVVIDKENLAAMKAEEHNPLTDAEVVREGQRNDTLYQLGCALRGRQGKEHEEIVGILLEYNSQKCNPPLDESEVLSIADSVCEHPAEVAVKKSAERIEQNPLYWFAFNTRDWFANESLALMDDRQTGWYIRLKVFAWQKGGFLPADHEKLCKLAKAKSSAAFERDCELVLAEYVEVDVNGERKLKNPVMAKEYANTLELWMKKKAAGEARARQAGWRAKHEPAAASPSAPATVQ